MEDESAQELNEIKNILEDLKKQLEQEGQISEKDLERYQEHVDKLCGTTDE